MLIALFADIHSNREALSACLAHAQQRRPERYIFLGDMVGYGADPLWVLDTVMDFVSRGALAVLGNHDAAAAGDLQTTLHGEARKAIDWTRAQLGEAHLRFLRQLPLTAEANDCLFVHASAAAPRQWDYVTGTAEAVRSMHATECRVTFCGHVHEPALYNMSGTGKISQFIPSGDSSIPLSAQRRWLVLPGSVGQPRDRNPAACYALYDDARGDLTYFRVPYDYLDAAEKIRAAGLPEPFAARLEFGI